MVWLLKTSTITVLKLNLYLETDMIPVLLFGFWTLTVPAPRSTSDPRPEAQPGLLQLHQAKLQLLIKAMKQINMEENQRHSSDSSFHF